MTDKEKIREEVKNLHGNPYYMMAIKDVLSIIDSLQEEPVSEIDFEQELYKAFGQVKDFTLGMRIAKRFYEMGRNHQEPVSEELEEAANDWNEKASFNPFYMVMNGDTPVDVKQDITTHADSFKAGAQWQEKRLLPMIDKICGMCQKQQDFIDSKDLGELISTLSRRYPEVSFAKLSRIAVRVAKWKNEQMMANAGNGRIDAVSNRQTRAHITVVFDSPRDIEVLDRIKVIVIKED